MSGPHSPRPESKSATREALRQAFRDVSPNLYGEDYPDEEHEFQFLSPVQNADLIFDALPAADPAATADVAWEALKSDIIKSCPDDFPIAILAVTAHRPSIEAAIRSAEAPIFGYWTCVSTEQPPPSVVSYSRPILLDALRDGRETTVISGYRWDYVEAAIRSAGTPPASRDNPEAYCHRCGGPNVVWSAPSPLWNAVMRVGDREPFDGIVCPTCFAVLAGEGADLWRFYAERVTVPVETTFGDGRLWDPVSWMWVEPATPPEPVGGREALLRAVLRRLNELPIWTHEPARDAAKGSESAKRFHTVRTSEVRAAVEAAFHERTFDHDGTVLYDPALQASPPTGVSETLRLDVERLAMALWAWGFDATGPVIRDDVKGPTDGQRRIARKLAAEYLALVREQADSEPTE